MAISRPLNAQDSAKWAAFKKRAAKNMLQADAIQEVSIKVKQSLLKQANHYTKRHKLNMSELFTRGLRQLIEKP